MANINSYWHLFFYALLMITQMVPALLDANDWKIKKPNPFFIPK